MGVGKNFNTSVNLVYAYEKEQELSSFLLMYIYLLTVYCLIVFASVKEFIKKKSKPFTVNAIK